METNSIKEKLYGFHKSSWIDISDKELIIYGAGQGCLDMENELELSSIFSVVDGKEELIGRKIMLLSREYTIESPAILNELDNNRYCVIISSEKYYEEIKADIKRRYSCSLNIFLWKTEIRYGYSTIDELCYLDPLFRRKLSDAHLIRKAN